MTTVDPRTPAPPGARAVGVRRRRTSGVYASPTGKKAVMAVTGLFLLLYVVVHLVGNLKLFLGAAQLDHYAEWLRTLGEPLLPRTVLLWLFRVVLVAAFVLHVHAAASLTRLNRAARPQGYQDRRQWTVASYASRTMMMSGTIVALFVVYHLLDLTWGPANPDFVRGDVHANVVASFERWPVALVYVLGNVALGLHLAHGVWSAAQTLGADSPAWERARRATALTVAGAIVAGNVSMPLAVQAGWVS
jgi:succinate dehydrogenase / fumarate reductase cytochrome b subunit